MSKTTRITVYIVASVGIIALLCCSTVLIFGRTINDLILDNKTVYLNCDQLPSIEQVEAAVQEHRDLIKKIEEVQPGYIFVEIYPKENCVGKGLLLISYSSHSQRVQIEALIASDTFFGIPYQLENH